MSCHFPGRSRVISSAIIKSRAVYISLQFCKAFIVHTYFTLVSPLEQKSKRKSSAITTLDILEEKNVPSCLIFTWFPGSLGTTELVRHKKDSKFSSTWNKRVPFYSASSSEWTQRPAPVNSDCKMVQQKLDMCQKTRKRTGGEQGLLFLRKFLHK